MRLIDAVTTAEIISKEMNIPLDELVDVFAKVSTVEPKKGKWINNINGGYCKVCSSCRLGISPNTIVWDECNQASDEREYSITIEDLDAMNFCPRCGADMRGEK